MSSADGQPMRNRIRASKLRSRRVPSVRLVALGTVGVLDCPWDASPHSCNRKACSGYGRGREPHEESHGIFHALPKRGKSKHPNAGGQGDGEEPSQHISRPRHGQSGKRQADEAYENDQIEAISGADRTPEEQVICRPCQQGCEEQRQRAADPKPQIRCASRVRSGRRVRAHDDMTICQANPQQ
jgi:hypothetical protein